MQINLYQISRTYRNQERRDAANTKNSAREKQYKNV